MPKQSRSIFDIILSRSMPRNKFFVGSIFSGLFFPRKLRMKGLSKLHTKPVFNLLGLDFSRVLTLITLVEYW